MKFKRYLRKQFAELAHYHPGDDLEGVSIGQADRAAGRPHLGDMIARNPANHADRWIVAEDYFLANFEEADAAAPKGTLEHKEDA